MSMATEPVRMRIEHTEAAAQKDRLIIELATECGAEADNEDMVIVMHEHGREFWDAVMPTIHEAFERIILERLRRGTTASHPEIEGRHAQAAQEPQANTGEAIGDFEI